jgi:hypothetical protein
MSDEIRVHKVAMTMRVSDEFWSPTEPAGHMEPPTQEEVAEYTAWRKAFKPLHKQGVKRGWWRDGGPDYGPEYQRPEGRWVAGADAS